MEEAAKTSEERNNTDASSGVPQFTVSGSMASPGQHIHASKLSLTGIIIDTTIICAVGLTLLFVTYLAEPYHRGFFCDDDSIRLPFKGDTVVPALLIVMSIGVPTAVITGCETWAVTRDDTRRRRVTAVCGRLLSEWVVHWLWTVAVFVLGAGLQQVAVDAAKYSLGRLRPHFLDVCQPSPSCKELADPHIYVSDYRCNGTDQSLVHEARLSFPSGHSSLSFYAAVFTVLFLEHRFDWPKRARVQKVFCQFLVLVLAWLTALSRITDHKHHWSDVLAGMALGSAAAYAMVKHVVFGHGSSWASKDLDHIPSEDSLNMRGSHGRAPPQLSTERVPSSMRGEHSVLDVEDTDEAAGFGPSGWTRAAQAGPA